MMKLPITSCLPIAAAFWIFWIIRIASMEECSSLMQNLMQICCSTCSIILNVTAIVHMVTEGHLPPPLTRYCEVAIVQACAFQSTLGCQGTPVLCKWCKPFSSYWQWLDFLWTDLIYMVPIWKAKFIFRSKTVFYEWGNNTSNGYITWLIILWTVVYKNWKRPLNIYYQNGWK